MRDLLRSAGTAAGLVLAVLAAGFALLRAELSPEERAVVDAVLTPPRVGLLAMLALLLAGAVGALAWRWHLATRGPARRIAESARLAIEQPGHRAEPAGAPELREVCDAVNALAEAHARTRVEMETRVAAARADVEAERNRLAALMSELRSAVIVCNADGQILLYNPSAQALLAGDERAAVGLGRSVFGVLDRGLVVHALDAAVRRHRKGDARPTAQFVAAGPRGGQIRVSLAPVIDAEARKADGEARDATGAPGDATRIATAIAAPQVGAFVLVAADVTQTIEQSARRDALLQGVIEDARGALANIRAAVENLVEYPDMPATGRARFIGALRDEAVRLSGKLEQVTAEFSDVVKSEWAPEDMRADDLVAVARARIESRLSLPTKIESVDSDAWVRVDSFAIAQALTYLAARLREEFSVREVRFRLAAGGRHVHLDLLWTGAPLSPETAFAWENDPFNVGGEASPLTLRAVITRHHGEVWYTRDRPTQSAYYRLVLPMASAPSDAAASAILPAIAAGASSRPEYYDFDLFRRSAPSHAADDRPLADLAYTVFDTETTGLDPSAGDEIISLGAVRIVNARLLHGETFESLVASSRTISRESMAVHGITAEMLAGQPPIERVLPRFHRFAADTVLVAHNAAFDLRFLSMQEERAGVRFDQPVLDTLLLSAVVHPNQEGHGLEAIAARLGVAVIGRHTSLGDALLTGEVFLRLLPLLAQKGIRTLGDAQEAAEKTWYARVRY